MPDIVDERSELIVKNDKEYDDDTTSESPPSTPKSNCLTYTLSTLVLFGFATAGLLFFITYRSRSHLQEVSNDDYVNILDTATDKFTFYRVGYNELSFFDGSTLSYAFLSNYDTIIEPYVPMALNASDLHPQSDFYYDYNICPQSNNNDECFTGTTNGDASKSTYVTIPCSAQTEYVISVTKVSSNNQTEVLQLSAICMFVRREIRDLTDEDLDKTLDAMHLLWTMTDEEGQAIYGSDFHNSTFFTAAHFYGAAQRNADHIHEGLGFLLQHLKLSNWFEKALQSIDPSLTLPYWDFTMDTASGTSMFDNFLFQENTFGSLSPAKDDYWGWTYRNNSVEDAKIPDGRWANLKADNYNWYMDLPNGFGYLRAPWNQNPSIYISRFVSENEFPGCSAYYRWFKKTSLSKFMEFAPGPPHARTHGNIGGVFGCDLLDFLYDDGIVESTTKQKLLCSQWGFKLKDLYRQGYITTNKGCTTVSKYDSTDSTCGFQCDDNDKDDMIEAMESSMGGAFVSNVTYSQYEMIREFICYGNGARIFYGDHLEAASAADPSFWVIHPAQERALHAKFIVGGFEDNKWNSDYIDDYVCDRNECYDDEAGDLVYNPSCCLGHFEQDGFPDFITANSSNTLEPSNLALLVAMDASQVKYGLNYIYDDFDWSHCSDGVNKLLADLLSGDDDGIQADDDEY